MSQRHTTLPRAESRKCYTWLGVECRVGAEQQITHTGYLFTPKEMKLFPCNWPVHQPPLLHPLIHVLPAVTEGLTAADGIHRNVAIIKIRLCSRVLFPIKAS